MNELMNKGELPLKNIKIIDGATLGAGPFAATFLGDFGADVIKLEYPEGGDDIRQFGPENAVWKWASRNKRSIAVDLHEEEGKEVLKELVRDADVFINNFRTGRLKEWDIGWETLSEINPNLVMVRTTGFGTTGPYKDKPGFGTLAEGMSGFASVTGPGDGPPTLPGTMLGDSVSSLFSTFGILIGLYWRDVEDGSGQHIDTSILEPMFMTMADHALRYSVADIVHERQGNRQPGNPGRNTYKTKDDEWVALSPGGDAIIERVLKIVGGDEAVDNPRFQSQAARQENIDELEQLIQDWMDEHTRKEVRDIFEEYEAAVAPVYDMEDIFEDPHFKERDAIIEVNDDEFGNMEMPGIFPKLSKTPGKVRHTGPTLVGEHTKDILLEETSLEEEEIADLEDRGIIKTEDGE